MRVLVPGPPPDPAVEHQRQAAPEHGPHRRFAQRRLVRVPVEHEHVEHQQHDRAGAERDPIPGRHVQMSTLRARGRDRSRAMLQQADSTVDKTPSIHLLTSRAIAAADLLQSSRHHRPCQHAQQPAERGLQATPQLFAMLSTPISRPLYLRFDHRAADDVQAPRNPPITPNRPPHRVARVAYFDPSLPDDLARDALARPRVAAFAAARRLQ